MPVRSNKAHQPAGLLIAGISPRLRLDNLYRAFLELAAAQVATSVAKARVYEEERKRAEALAEIDRAKTAFFSNVSHEFRTPLTLMLGPLEDELAENTLGPASHDRLALVHRSGLRLQKLVNSLLDFSRIEAGRVQAVYEPTDLATLTTDLASNFRSAMEKASLQFHVNCPQLAEPVYVDREMWEKIVLNLLSNAFKFTLEGSVTITLRSVAEGVELSVQDTGTGIPAQEMPHLFERFHRIKDARGRTFEGTGIGLAIVNELVKLHGGSVRAESELDKGSVFRVCIPFGVSHLPGKRIGSEHLLASTALHSEAYVEEALRWLPDDSSMNDTKSGPPVEDEVGEAPAPGTRDTCPGKRVLLADDNADMRQYIERLLSSEYVVTAVANGEEALRAARKQLPDLVLTDAMMPGLDGFGLLRALRADPLTAMVPVILLSARAGEESRIEGLDAGADDYLIKPFSARELTARIRAALTLADVRREAQAELRKRETELRRANEELEQFAYSASHDLKEPLRMVTAYSQLLSRRSSPKLDAQEKEFLARVLQGAQRMDTLLADLLRYARAASEPELSDKAVELNSVFERALGNLQAAIEESRAQISCGPLPALFVEPIRLQQVFQNLVGNAIKYRRQEKRVCVKLSARREDSEWIFSVEDNGLGIEPQYQRQIFGLFKRLHNDGLSGSGLGLAICQRTVEHYRGRIWVESKPGDGATFFFALPAALEHAT
jgi:signal transduction histidine kinase